MNLSMFKVPWVESLCSQFTFVGTGGEEKIYGKCLCFENRRQMLTSAGLAFLTDYLAIAHRCSLFSYLLLPPRKVEVYCGIFTFNIFAFFYKLLHFSPFAFWLGPGRVRLSGQVKQSGKSYHQICKPLPHANISDDLKMKDDFLH